MSPNFPSKTLQNRLKPLRGILYHPRQRNALRTPLKCVFGFWLSPLDLKSQKTDPLNLYKVSKRKPVFQMYNRNLYFFDSCGFISISRQSVDFDGHLPAKYQRISFTYPLTLTLLHLPMDYAQDASK